MINKPTIKIGEYRYTEEIELEEDNRKIFHFAKAPGEAETILHHTPYEHLSREDFSKYVVFHIANGRWPGRRATGNWRKELLDELVT
ncbi:MAG: hypothetical protein ACYSW0_18395 [Planctomycetota bacterium]|jgi:hypothetical protein